MSSRHSTRTVYFVSMNIRLHSLPEVNGTFYILQSQPQENSLSTFYILNLKGTYLSLDSQEDTSTPSSTSTLAVIYHASELLRLRYSLFVKNVVRVNDHHLGLYLQYTVIFLNILLQIIPFFKPKISVTCILYFKHIFSGKLN